MTADSAPAGGLRGVHVVLVSGDGDSCELMKTVLAYAGALVTAADSTRAALDIMESVRPDVIVGDLRFGGDDVSRLIREVRKLPALASTPAVAVTSRADRLRALEAGFQAQLGAPIDPWELCDVVARLASPRT
jgi:two-component system CheB/CheR fusion protein